MFHFSKMRSESMRMSKHFATGAALAAAAAMALTACGGGGAAGTTGAIAAGVAYETADYGPITTSALAMGSNWQVLEGLYRFNMAEQAAAMEAGAYAVIVGTVITHPTSITTWFKAAVEG